MFILLRRLVKLIMAGKITILSISFVRLTSSNSNKFVCFVNFVCIWRGNELLVLDVLIDERFLFFSTAAVVWISVLSFNCWKISLVRCRREIRLNWRLEADNFTLIKVRSWGLFPENVKSDCIVMGWTLLASVGSLCEDSYLIFFSVTEKVCTIRNSLKQTSGILTVDNSPAP